MPLSDFFRFPQDPLVQAGVMSRGDNWQMRLGSLAAGLADYDRAGTLGQALARAGAIYQSQRQGALASAFERAQEEAKRAREEELYAQQRKRFANEEADRLREEGERRAAAEKAASSDKAMRARLKALGLDENYADNPAVAQSAIDEAEMAARPKEPKAPGGFQAVPESGRVYRTNPVTGEIEEHDFGRMPGKPRDPANLQRFTRPDGTEWTFNPDTGEYRQAPLPASTRPKGSDFSVKDLDGMAKDLLDSEWADAFTEGTGRPPDYADAVTEAMNRKRTLESILAPQPTAPMRSGGTFEMMGAAGRKIAAERAKQLQGGTKTVKPQGGETVGGMVMPDPKKSSAATAKMGLVSGKPKVDEEKALSMARLESVKSSAALMLPPPQAAALDTEIQRLVAQGIDPEDIAEFIEAQLTRASAR